jgi:5-oxopent-3-ene-1,2,5-tricarboxylate decarboxylase/2-hydroxyhepta-2,4-diene-1,7-dioate isomerase
LAHRRSLSGLLRPAHQLLADVSEFMTLEAGDILMLGAPDDAPLARAGQSVRIEVDGLGALGHSLVAEPPLDGQAVAR